MKKQRHWLDFAEYASLVGLGVGSVASFVSSQVLYTSAPLSMLVLLNLANRRRFEFLIGQNTAIAVTDLDRKLSKNIELLNQQVLDLPTPEAMGSLKKTLLIKNREVFDELSDEISKLKQEVSERFAVLDRHNLGSVRQDMTHMQEQYNQLNGAVAHLNVQLNQLASSTRIDDVEGAIARLKANTLQLRDNLQMFADQTRPTLTSLQDQVNHLNRQFQKMPPPFDATALRQEVTELIRVVSDLVPKREWHNLQTEIKALQQQQEIRNQSEEVLRRKLQELNQQIQVRPVKANLTSLQNQINHLNRQIQKLPPPFDSTSLKREITQLVKAVGDLVPKRDWSALTTQIKALQKQQEFQQQFETTLQQELRQLNQQLETLSSATARQAVLPVGEAELVQSDMAASLPVQATIDYVEPTQEPHAVPMETSFPAPAFERQAEFQGRIETVLNQELQALDQQLRQMPSGSQLQAQIETTVERELQDINEQLRSHPTGPHYELVFDFRSHSRVGHEAARTSSTRAALEKALDVTQERLILILPWSSQCPLDDRLLHQLETFLQRGRQLDVGWCHRANRDEERFLSVINHRWSINPIQKDLQATLQKLLQLKRTYPQHFQFKVLGTSGNFLVSDQAFAIMGIDEALVATRSLPEMELKLWTDDVEVIQRCMTQFDHPAPNPNDITAHWNQAVTRYDLSDREGAMTDFNQVLSVNPNDAIAYNYRGLTHYDLGNLAEAIADFSRSLDLNPHQVATYCNRGFIRSEQGDQLGAISDFSLAIERQPTSAIAYFYRGMADQKYNDSLAAASDFGEVIRLMPDSPMAYYYRGQAYQKLENLRGAIADFETAAHLFDKRGNTTNAEKARRNVAKLRRAMTQPSVPSAATQTPITPPSGTSTPVIPASVTPTPVAPPVSKAQPSKTQPSKAPTPQGQPAVSGSQQAPSGAKAIQQPSEESFLRLDDLPTPPPAGTNPQPKVNSQPQTNGRSNGRLEVKEQPLSGQPTSNSSATQPAVTNQSITPGSSGGVQESPSTSTQVVAHNKSSAVTPPPTLHPVKVDVPVAPPVEPVSVKSVFVEPVFVEPVFVEPVTPPNAVSPAIAPVNRPGNHPVKRDVVDQDEVDEDKTELLDPPYARISISNIRAMEPEKFLADQNADSPFTVDDFFQLQPDSNEVTAPFLAREESIADIRSSADHEITTEAGFSSDFNPQPQLETPDYKGIDTLSNLFFDVAPKAEVASNGAASSGVALESKGDRTVDETLDDFGSRF